MAREQDLDIDCTWVEDRILPDEQLIYTLRLQSGDFVHEVPVFAGHARRYEESEDVRRSVEAKLRFAIQSLTERGH